MGQRIHTSKVNVNSHSIDSGIAPERAERGERIKALRTSRELSQTEFAVRMGVTKQTQIAYESGARVPDADYLAELFFQFAVDLGPLVTGAPRPKAIKVTAGVEEMLRRYEALPAPARKTVDDVLLLAWLAYQDRRAVHEEVDGPQPPTTRGKKAA